MSDKQLAFELLVQVASAIGFGLWQGSIGAGVFVFGVTLTVLYQVNIRRSQ